MTSRNPIINWDKFLQLSKSFFYKEIKQAAENPEHQIGDGWFDDVYQKVYPRSSPAINILLGTTAYSAKECTSYFYIVKASGRFQVNISRRKGVMIEGRPSFIDSKTIDEAPTEEDLEVFKFGMTVKEDILSRDKIHYKEVIKKIPVPPEMQYDIEAWFCLVMARDLSEDAFEYLVGTHYPNPLESVRRSVKSIDSKKAFAKKEAFLFRGNPALLGEIAETAFIDLQEYRKNPAQNSFEANYASRNITQVISNSLYWAALIRSESFRKERGCSMQKQEKIAHLLASDQSPRDFFHEGVVTHLGNAFCKEVDSVEPKLWDFAVRYGFDEILTMDFWQAALD